MLSNSIDVTDLSGLTESDMGLDTSMAAENKHAAIALMEELAKGCFSRAYEAELERRFQNDYFEIEAYKEYFQASSFYDLVSEFKKKVKGLSAVAKILSEANEVLKNIKEDHGSDYELVILGDEPAIGFLQRARAFNKWQSKVDLSASLGKYDSDEFPAGGSTAAVKRVHHALVEHIKLNLIPILGVIKTHLGNVIKCVDRSYMLLDEQEVTPSTRTRVSKILCLIDKFISAPDEMHKSLNSKSELYVEFKAFSKQFPDFSQYLDRKHLLKDDKRYTKVGKFCQAAGEQADAEFRRSDLARSLRFLAALEDPQTDQGKIKKLVTQLSALGPQGVCTKLSECAGLIIFGDAQIELIKKAFSPMEEAREKVEDSPEAENHAASCPVTDEPLGHAENSPEDTHLLKEILLDELNVKDIASRHTLLECATVASLETAWQILSGLDPLLKDLIVDRNPLLIDPKSPVSLLAFVSELREVYQLCSGLERFEAFDIKACPEHFDNIETLRKTGKAAKILKQIINEVREEQSTKSVEPEDETGHDSIKSSLNSLGVDVELCFSTVYHGFWFNGYLSAGARVMRLDHVLKNVNSHGINTSLKELTKLIKSLIEHNVIIAVGKRRASLDLLSLQYDPTKVTEGPLRDLLRHTLLRRGIRVVT